MKLRDKVAVITGGNSGIGLATAKLFLQEGAKISILGRNAKTLAAAAGELGPETIAIQGDVTDHGALTRLFDETRERHGAVDTLIVNAGVSVTAPIEDTTEEMFDQVCNVNFKGAFFTIQKSLPYFAGKGSIVMVGSAAWHRAWPHMPAYAGTKAAVCSLARSLAVGLQPRSIRVNVLAPGPIDTPIFDRIGLTAEQKAGIVHHLSEQVPMHRFGEPMEMARAALFLASDDSSYVTGTELVADGGWAVA